MQKCFLSLEDQRFDIRRLENPRVEKQAKLLGLMLLGSAALLACGSKAGGPAATPEAATPEAATMNLESEESDSEEADEPSVPEGPALSRSVEDIISEPDNAWVFNFQRSEPYEKAEKKCDERFEGKPKERAHCMSKERASFVGDAMEFKKDRSGQDVWVVYRAQGNRLIQVYTVPVSYEDEQAGVLRIKKAGKGKGSAPLMSSETQFDVKLLSNYVMEITDARLGRLTYDARIGFISK